ncbi:cupin domain-containing protein [Mesorhizobium sp. WSM2239]|uniref:Cupin domain-containing protein n=2 Tax=unclassified Mesorhizobium TaxID=325217 RepID=A0AAU8DDF7_9HYPH
MGPLLSAMASLALVGATSLGMAQELNEIDRPASELKEVLAHKAEIPAGANQIRVVRVELEPNTAAAWHTHPSPVYVYVVEGELVMEVEGQEPRTIGPGEAVAEPLDARMRVLNTTEEPARAVVFQVSPTQEEFLEQE